MPFFSNPTSGRGFFSFGPGVPRELSRIMGAGGGGFMIFYAPPSAQESVKRALSKLIHVPFKFEDCGSRVLYGGEH